MLSVILPLACVVGAVWPAVCPTPVLLVLDIITFIPTALRKDECTIAVLFILEKLSSVDVATGKSDGAEAMHHIVHPIALVSATFGEAGSPMTMLLSIMIVTFVLKLRYLAVQYQRL